MVQYRPDGGETTSVVNNSNKRIPEGGCLSNNYTIEESKKTVENFNRLLGASTLSYEYEYTDSETGRIKNRLGAKYDKSIEHTFILKTR